MIGAQGFVRWPLGVVFDLDGTLTSNMHFHVQAFDAFAARHGRPPLDAAMRMRLDGKRNADIMPIFFDRAFTPEEIAVLADEKEREYRRLSRGGLSPLPGLVRFLDLLEERAIPVAIATSAPAENVPHTLGEIGLLERFPRVARSDEQPRGKPHPDVFLAAAAKIGVDPRECIAFEDAPTGVLAARAAGMIAVALTTSFDASHFAAAAPHLYASDYEHFLAGPFARLLG
ncbi:MAG: HAD family phosphatase [Planctomycetes bacterium]|nr:HAD family phosphatase [Planctomycetota bacterium]